MSRLHARDIAAFLQRQQDKATLRFITCGSVDDGKSTLIGRLLFESKAIFDDQLAALAIDSRQYGTQGDNIDLALLVDGLQAEREQGITIDVAYRFFATEHRRFIVADTPGHEQYTRNMATGASTADLAVILVDARKGLLTQTRRHSRIVALMGIRQLVLAVNKMDLVAFDPAVYDAIVADYRAFLSTLGEPIALQPIPVSGLAGDNILHPSPRMAWYEGPTLLEHLNTVAPPEPAGHGTFRMPVQWVNRPNDGFRGFAGRIASGRIHPGDPVRILPSGVLTQVKAVWAGFNVTQQACAGDAVTLTLVDEVDASRGDLIAAATQPPQMADQFEVRLLWMSPEPMTPGRQYLLKTATREVSASVTRVQHLQDVNTGAHLAARALQLNDIAVAHLATAAPVVFEAYRDNRTLGSFILVDKLSLQTVGAGMIEHALRRSDNIHWQALDVDQQARAQLKGQTARCIWFTGLSGAGKSTIANLLEKRLHGLGRHTYVLDGDNLRHGLNRDLGFSEADRVENIRRVAQVARLMVDAGLIVLVSFISPFRRERYMAREQFAPGAFAEVFVDTPLAECERRDAKGLYAQARAGRLPNFTGVDSPYEAPEAPEVHLLADQCSAQDCAEHILQALQL
jgi:bifunctional enzyme CysN/CysC